VLFSPQRFFDELPPDGPLGAPVLYFLICSAITAVINVVASLTFLAVPVGIALATGSLDAGQLVSVLTDIRVGIVGGVACIVRRRLLRIYAHPTRLYPPHRRTVSEGSARHLARLVLRTQ